MTVRLLCGAAVLAALCACTPREPVAEDIGASMAIPTPQGRSYLDPGPLPPGSGGPNYVRANRSTGPRQTDGFGNDILSVTP